MQGFSDSITQHTMLNEGMLSLFMILIQSHPMAMVSAIVGSMSAYYHDTMDINSARAREIFFTESSQKYQQLLLRHINTLWGNHLFIH